MAEKKTKTAKQGFLIKRSYSGLGLFAESPFKRGQKIIEYKGPLIPNKIAEDIITNRYLFDVNSRWTIDGRGRENTARYANHSCKPNAEAEIRGKQVFIIARKKILPGDEIVYDYGKEYFDEYIKPAGCKCNPCKKPNFATV